MSEEVCLFSWGKKTEGKKKIQTPFEGAWQSFCTVLKSGEELDGVDLDISHIASTMDMYRALCPHSRLYDG